MLIEKESAKKRQAENAKATTAKREGTKREPVRTSEKGRASDKAGEKTGVSGKTAERPGLSGSGQQGYCSFATPTFPCRLRPCSRKEEQSHGPVYAPIPESIT